MPVLAYITTVAVTQYYNLRGQNRYLAERGWTLHAIAAPDPLLDKLAERDGAVVHPVPMSRSFSPLADLRSLWRLICVLRRVRPDLLHLSTPKGALLGAVAGFLCRVPVRVFLVRGLPSSGRSGWRATALCLLEALTARLCHQQICVSGSLLKYARSVGIVAPGRGMVAAKGMSNGVDLRALEEGCAGEVPESLRKFCTGETLVIGFSGRLVRDKGIEDLAAAWGRLREDFSHLRLLICGTHEEDDPVDPSVVQRLTSDERVLITGWIDKQCLGHYYRAMDIFAFPSYREGFPNGPMEAAAYGLPVIVSEAVGCCDAVEPGVTGAVVPERDAAALECALRRYIVNADLRRTHGEAGRRRVEKDFAPEGIWSALDAEYRRLLLAAGIRSGL